MSNFSPMYFEQPIVLFDTTESLNATTGSFVLYGGVSVSSTYESNDISTGSMVLRGGMAIQKNLNVAGIQHITNDTDSTGVSDGALVVDGGVGIAKNLHVGGDTTIMGSLFVQGTYTYVNTQTINVEDNTLVINSGPGGSRDAGILIHRDGADVTSDAAFTNGSLATVSATSVTFGSTAQPDGFYNGWWIKLNNSNGYAQIEHYSDGTNSATLYTGGNTLTSGNLTETGFTLYNKSYLAQYYDEQSDELRFAYIADAEDPKVNLENGGMYADLRLNNLYAETSVSSASLYAVNSSIASLYAVNSSIATLAVTTLNAQSVSMESVELVSATIGGLNVTGESVLQGTVTAGALNVTGESVLQGAVTAGALNVTGQSILQGAVTAGALNVTGESLLQGAVTTGALNVTGETILQLGVTAGALFVTGGSLMQGSLTVSGGSVFNGGVTTGALNVTGASIFNVGITAGALYVTGASIMDIGLTTGSLNVTGESIMQDNLTVTTGSVVFSTNDYSPIIDGASPTGSIVFNTVDVSPSLGDISRERILSVNNNQSVAADITGFAFNSTTVRAFDAIVSVTILSDAADKYAYYNLKGINKDNNWVINSSFIGDLSGFTFSITNLGQVQYTSTNVTGYQESYVSFRALTTSVKQIV